MEQEEGALDSLSLKWEASPWIAAEWGFDPLETAERLEKVRGQLHWQDHGFVVSSLETQSPKSGRWASLDRGSDALRTMRASPKRGTK